MSRLATFVFCLAACLSVFPTSSKASIVGVIWDSDASGVLNDQVSELLTFLGDNGHTTVDLGSNDPASTLSAGSLTGLDTAFLIRTNGNAALETWVRDGGRLVTEFGASTWALGAGLLDGVSDQGASSIRGNPQGFLTTDAAVSGLGDGVNDPYTITGSVIFRFFGNPSGSGNTEEDYGEGVQVLARRQASATNPSSTKVAMTVGGPSDLGTTLLIGYNWIETFDSSNADTRQLVLNAVEYRPVPEPASIALWMVGAIAAVLLRRRFF